jgi:uncharacterized protein (TIGR00369 family)
MAIWKQPVTIGAGLPTPAGTCGATLGITFTEVGEDFLRGTMPVDARTKQPFGRLHGGASCVLAEELGSFAANLCIAPGEGLGVGLEINANHLRAATGGQVTGTARPLHIGRATQVWDIRIEDAAGKLVCISRLTMAVIASTKA